MKSLNENLWISEENNTTDELVVSTVSCCLNVCISKN